ncbi:MAG: hypothetical protein HC813_03065 [Planctomycetes bacterium]|nr:hypothetical protein [Planctomycetota bacterium]
MRVLPCFFALALLTGALRAQEGEALTPYEHSEVDNFLAVFKDSYGKKKIPQEDAIATLQNLVKAHRYFSSKGAEATKEDAKTKEKIVKYIALGLKAKDREMVSWECAKALGVLADPDGQRPLLKWMEDVVLDDKAPPIQSVEAGFLSLALIGGEDKNTLDVIRSYATGKHVDPEVAKHALRAVIEWRSLASKERKEHYEKISGYLLGLWSAMKGGETRTRGSFETKYNTVKENGLLALSELAGDGSKFTEPQAAAEWYKEHKKEKWEDYVGPRFRPAASEKPSPENKPEEEAS